MNNISIFKIMLLCTFFISCTKEDINKENNQLCTVDAQEQIYIQKEEYKEGIIMNTYCILGASTASMEWQRIVANRVSQSCNNYAIPGSRWAYGLNSNYNGTIIIADQVNQLIQDKNNDGYYPDLITIMCGLNDSAGGYIGGCQDAYSIDYISDIKVDDLYSEDRYKIYRESVYGAMRYVIEVLKKEFPQSCILLMTVHQIDNANYNSDKIIYINQIINNLSIINSIPVIDVYNECGINKFNKNIMLDDLHVHPNEEGSKLLAKYVEKQVRLKYVCNK